MAGIQFGGRYYIPERYRPQLEARKQTIFAGIEPVYSQAGKYGKTVDIPDHFDQQFEKNLKAVGVDEFIRRENSRGAIEQSCIEQSDNESS